MPAGRFFPWGTPVDGRGCRAASQVLKAATREPEINLTDATDKVIKSWVHQLTDKVRRETLVMQTFVSLAEARQTDGLLV